MNDTRAMHMGNLQCLICGESVYDTGHVCRTQSGNVVTAGGLGAQSLFGVPVKISPLMPKDTALFVQNGEIASKLHRLVTEAEEERIAAAVAADRARVVALVDALEALAEAQGHHYSPDYFQALADVRAKLTGEARDG